MKKLLLIFISVCFIGTANAQSVTRLIGSSPFQDSLWVFDSINFAVVKRAAPTMSGYTITGMTGLAKHPITNEIYVICKVSGFSTRLLGKLNPNTMIVTYIGDLGDKFASITFSSNGTLYGATGNGASVPETLYKINISDASKTLVTPMGAGADGEIICFNPTDNMIYHWSGNGTVVFEKLDTLGTSFTNIPLIGAAGGETFGMVHVSGNYFIGSNIGSRFQRWYSSGAVAPAHGLSAPDDIRGTALYTCSRIITGDAAFCVNDSTQLTMTGGGTAYQWYRNGSLITGATNQSYYVSSTGYYNCMITDACGTDSLAAGIAVSQNALPIVSLSGNSNLCPSSSTLLTGTSGGTRQWYKNGVLILGATATTYSATSPGVYNMIKTNINGCKDSASVGITVILLTAPNVTAASDDVDNTICEGASVALTGGGAISYTWSSSVADGVSFSPTATDTYTVTGTDGNNCTNTATITITVNTLPSVDLAAFSSSVCENGGVINLIDGTPSGGTFSGTGVVGNTFDPAAAGVGTWSITYTVTDANNCSNSDIEDLTVTVCTGIANASISSAINVYPNPANENINIDLSNIIDISVKVALVDITGKLIISEQYAGGKPVTMNVGSIANGVYSLVISTANDVMNNKITIIK
jgi:hypothetical protein